MGGQPYLDILPDGDALGNMPLLWSDEERARLLGGSHLEPMVAQAREEGPGV